MSDVTATDVVNLMRAAGWLDENDVPRPQPVLDGLVRLHSVGSHLDGDELVATFRVRMTDKGLNSLRDFAERAS